MWHFLALIIVLSHPTCFASTQTITNYPYIIGGFDFDTNVTFHSSRLFKNRNYSDKKPSLTAETFISFQNMLSAGIVGSPVDYSGISANTELIYYAKLQSDLNSDWQNISATLRNYVYEGDTAKNFNDVLLRYDFSINNMSMYASVDFEYNRSTLSSSETFEIGVSKPFHGSDVFAYSGKWTNEGIYYGAGVSFKYTPYTITFLVQKSKDSLDEWHTYPVVKLSYSSVGTHPNRIYD